MSRTRQTIVLTMLLALGACASTPVEDQYYSLVLAADELPGNAGRMSPQIHLIVGPVHLPEFLERRGLAMQISDNEIRTANHHFWAEPLEEAIAKVLTRDISRLGEGLAVDRDAGRWTEEGDCRVRLEFDRFHATNRSRVVSSGRYWILGPGESARQEFDLSEAIATDGYSSAVTALRLSLHKLAGQVVDSIDSSGLCDSRGANAAPARITPASRVFRQARRNGDYLQDSGFPGNSEAMCPMPLRARPARGYPARDRFRPA